MQRIAFATALLVAACAPVAQAPAPTAPVLHPYSTITPSATSELAAGLVASVETPLSSPTPSTYTISPGDTLSQIAERFHVSVDSLLLANPGLDPNSLGVGATLLIPGGTANAAFATPTPASAQILDVACRPMATGAAWCFALIHNDSPETLQNISGLISVLDSAGAVLASQDGALLLDLLPPGASLPLAVPFSGPLPLDFKPQVRILTALSLPEDPERYLPAFVQNVITKVTWSGRTAEMSGEVVLPPGSASAAQVWVAAVAYDESGRLVGWRRWESAGGMNPGTSMPFQLWVYSLAGEIDHVELVLQARP